jgi:hypothetical protein
MRGSAWHAVLADIAAGALLLLLLLLLLLQAHDINLTVQRLAEYGKLDSAPLLAAAMPEP